MIKKLLHTRMRVNDLERTVKFYENALELKVARRSISPRGAQIVFLATPNSDEEIEICQLPNSPSVQVQPDLMHLAFEVDDLPAFVAGLEKRGYKLSDELTKTSSGSIIAFLDAPEGYEVELIQRAKWAARGGAGQAGGDSPALRPRSRSQANRYCWARPASGPK